MLHYDLLTPGGEALDRAHVLPEYPRPQLRRESYLNLNGEWDYAVTKTGSLPDAYDGKILVPFPLESALSGVRRALGDDEYLIYSRVFDVPDGFLRDVTLLHFGAVDRWCTVLVNGVTVGSHEGGYLPADFDVSAALRPGRNQLTVLVRDGTSYDFPTGKQSRKRGGIWYTPVSGIWQTVWLESVCAGYIRDLKLTPDVKNSRVRLTLDCPGGAPVAVTVLADGKSVFETTTAERELEIPVEAPRLWSPEDPFLYDLVLKTDGDEVKSYFALRSFEVDGTHFLLNGKPYFVSGLLDQGYYSDGIYTPASYDVCRDDILQMKALGFNALRKHIKLEPMRFYYLCDTLGMLVLQDMVNVGGFELLKDSLLPLLGQKKRQPWVSVSERQKKNFTDAAVGTVEQLYNCPCVVCYTIFNEGWGQFDGDGLYKLLKTQDPSRVFDATSGWFPEVFSDVQSEHIYFKPIAFKKRARTLLLSEFGGYSFVCPHHVFNTRQNFGYRRYRSMKELEDAFVALYENEIEPNLPNGLAGAIYTQLSDVEDETNGILTYDRRVCKLDPARIRPLMERICAEGSR